MKKGISSEIILTIGVLLAAGIILLQLRSLFFTQERIAQKELVFQFASDLKLGIEKAIGTTGDAAFTYRPLIKKYTLGIEDDRILIHDKISGENVSFIVNNTRLTPNRIEDDDTICIMKLLPTVTTIPTTTTTIHFPPGQGQSKLGILTQFQKPGVLNFIGTAKPAVVKLLNGGGIERASLVKQTYPSTFIVGSIYESEQRTDGSPEERARQWFDRNRGTIEATNDVDCWEGYGEPVPGHTAEEMQWISAFEVERIKLLNGIGRKACIGSFSAGNPDITNPDVWPAFRPALEAAKQYGGYLSLHEYCSPRMRCDLCCIGNLCNMCDGDTGWLTLRYRKVYREYLQPNNLVIPIIITETGIDSGGCPDGCGWRAHTDANTYLQDLEWYDSNLKQDSYVIGATIYHYGLYDWNSFEIYPDLTGENGNDGPLVRYMNPGAVTTTITTTTTIPSEQTALIRITAGECEDIKAIRREITTTTTTIPSGTSGSGDIINCPDASLADYIDDYNFYRNIIYSAIDDEDLDQYTGDRDNAARLIAALITQESHWDQDACPGPTWGCGIMQITQGTADGGCADLGGYDGIKQDAEKNIRCGVRVLKGKLSQMESFNDYDSDNLIKLGIAAYNGGAATIQEAIEIAGDSKWENINNMDIMTQACTPYYSDPAWKADIIIRYVNIVYPGYQSWLDCETTLQCGTIGEPITDNSYNSCLEGINNEKNGVSYPQPSTNIKIWDTNPANQESCDSPKCVYEFTHDTSKPYLDVYDTTSSVRDQIKDEIQNQLESVNLFGCTISVHNKVAGLFREINQELETYKTSGTTYNFPSGTYTFDCAHTGAFSFRQNVNNPSVLSPHSFGIAVDINWQQNWGNVITPMACQMDIPPEVVEAFESRGFRWGGRFWPSFDPMHFEFIPSCIISSTTTTTTILININNLVNEMTIGQLVEQLIMSTPAGSKYKNFYLFESNVQSGYTPTPVIVDNIQIWPLVATDAEGGDVIRLPTDRDPGRISATELGNRYESGTMTLTDIEEHSRDIAQEMKQYNLNANLAPCLDVSSSGLMIIQERSFSENPNIVEKIGEAFIQGLHDEGVIATGKHFPGYGNQIKNTDSERVEDSRTLQDLEDIDLKPYEGLGNELDMIMMNSIIYTNIDPDNPAVFSPTLINKAREISSSVVLITDSLTGMPSKLGITPKESTKRAIINNDILLFSSPTMADDSYSYIIDMINSGEISEETIKEKVTRVLILKQKYGLVKNV